MDTDIEWLFEEVYRLQESHQLYFLSDWDCEVEDQADFKALLNSVHEQSVHKSFKYSFAYEQFEIKEQIIGCCNVTDQLINISNLTLSPSATQSIYITFQALKKLNVHRYLVITPAYFSSLDCLKQNGSAVIYYHLNDKNNFDLDYKRLSQVIEEQYIECIVITDPVFSAGIEFSLSAIKIIAELARQSDAYIVIDYSLGGLLWNEEELRVINSGKLGDLSHNKKFVFIDSLSKRLQLNGIKFSLVFGDEQFIDVFDRLAESMYGGLNQISLEIINRLYRPDNERIVLNMHRKQLGKIKANYSLIQTLSNDTSFCLAPTNSGFFTVIYSGNKTFKKVDAQKIILELLHDEHIIAIPNNRFSYFSDNKFGFRINLAKDQDQLLLGVRNSVRKIFDRLAD